MIVMMGCSPQLARWLGAQPAVKDDHIYNIPSGTIVVDVGDEGPWHWQADPEFVADCDPRR